MTGSSFIRNPVLRDPQTLAERGVLVRGDVGGIEELLDLQRFSAHVLWELLDQRAHLRELDEAITHSGLPLTPADPPVSEAQRNYAFGCRWLFLRSPIPLERLPEERLQTLRALAARQRPDAADAVDFMADALPLLFVARPDRPDTLPMAWEPGGTAIRNRAIVLGLGLGSLVTPFPPDPVRVRAGHHALRVFTKKLSDLLSEAAAYPVDVLLAE